MNAEEVSQYAVNELSDYLKTKFQDVDTSDRVAASLEEHKISGLLERLKDSSTIRKIF